MSRNGITKRRGLAGLVDDVNDELMVGDLDVSPLNSSDDLMGGASYGELQDDDELSDVSELLLMTPKRRPKPTSVSTLDTLLVCVNRID